jgi:hypothetical protein
MHACSLSAEPSPIAYFLVFADVVFSRHGPRLASQRQRTTRSTHPNSRFLESLNVILGFVISAPRASLGSRIRKNVLEETKKEICSQQ